MLSFDLAIGKSSSEELKSLLFKYLENKSQSLCAIVVTLYLLYIIVSILFLEAKGPKQKGCEPEKEKEEEKESEKPEQATAPSTEECQKTDYGCCPDGSPAKGLRYLYTFVFG